ncbi:hypothetical protein GCM10027515_29870 [Schumannella luteola]|uniref:DUF2178 domain-containing protein n=1 Tax=Schumannella luteola TaxID=472059 RepID=A0A852YBK1_9MICO|nr:hypothetical protein [Schumannella luteola]NYG99212.1 hypothetical protein [Schumannella luteola]TPX02522.1 hypothetical protein FJ656_21975 [Schumannella luteola]
MAFHEKRAWMALVVSIVVAMGYLILIAGRLGDAGHDASAVDYVPAMLISIGVGIVATIVGQIVLSALNPRDTPKLDVRDREIERLGSRVGQAFLVIGGLAGLGLAMLRVDPFWIAHALYLGFLLSSLLDCVTRVVVYRRGVPAW